MAGKYPSQIRAGGQANWQAVANVRIRKPRNGSPARNGLRGFWECRAGGLSAKAMSTSVLWNLSMFELLGVVENGMSGRNGQRKLGTTRGSPRRSRTAKTSRISRRAVKSRCAREWGGWGRLSVDGPGQHNPASSEDPGVGGVFHRMAVQYRVNRPDSVRVNFEARRAKTNRS